MVSVTTETRALTAQRSHSRTNYLAEPLQYYLASEIDEEEPDDLDDEGFLRTRRRVMMKTTWREEGEEGEVMKRMTRRR